MEHPIETLMSTTMDQLKTMIKTNTVIGEPIESPDGSMIIPVTKVGFGFGAGGSDIEKSSSGGSSSSGDDMPFCGGGGGGVSISPVAFMVISDDGIKMIQLDENTKIYEKMLDEAPKTIEKLQNILKTKKSGSKKPSRRSERHEEDQDS